MRREIKLIILVFVLVVGPAVAVSFLAARVLGSWQIVLQKRMETEAVHTLDQVSAAWEREKSTVSDALGGEGIVNLSASKVAALRLVHPWINGAFVFKPKSGLLYPPVESEESQGARPDGEQGVRGSSPVMLPAGISECRRLLDQPTLTPPVRAEILLHLAGIAMAAGETNQALAAYQQVVRMNPSSPPRDPEEGFYYDLIALKKQAEATNETDRRSLKQEILRRVLARYDDLAPLQRDLMAEWIETSDRRPQTSGLRPQTLDSRPRTQEEHSLRSDVSGLRPDVSLTAEWRERMRGRELTLQIREGLERDLTPMISLVPGDGWLRGRAGGQDVLVQKRGTTEKNEEGYLFVLPFTEVRLTTFLNTLFAGITTNSGIQIVCSAGEPVGPVSGLRGLERALSSPRLASRRLPAPLDALTLTAYPSDPRTFSLNARLQTNFYRWGGLLLMISIVAGVWLIWRQAAMEIRQARERSDFAATVSHDLRTPLSSMRMLAESLYMGHIQDETKKQKFLGAIIKESDRLSQLTDRALYFIRYGQDALRYRFTEGDLGVLVKNVVEVFAIGVHAEVREAESEVRVQGSGFRVQEAEFESQGSGVGVQGSGVGGTSSCELSEPLNPEPSPLFPPPTVILLRISPDVLPVQFDGGAMEQVVFNLLDNAVKYSDKVKGVRIEVTLEPASPSAWLRAGGAWARRAKLGGPEIVLSVRDHGEGMTPDDVRRILKPYARGSGAARRNARGIGLGLALCHHVVKAHGGRIQIESTPGQGSVFRVIIPVG